MMDSTFEERLQELGLTLPVTPLPVLANSVPAVRTGNLLFLANQLSRTPDGKVLQGRLGQTMRVVEVFGDRGRHTRCAVGMASLPRGAAVQLDVVLEVAE